MFLLVLWFSMRTSIHKWNRGLSVFEHMDSVPTADGKASKRDLKPVMFNIHVEA